jgi:MerR family transcriptional regulator, light-induced transcriptional regulator
MPKSLERIRDFIVENQDDLARSIVERQWKLRPDLELRYGSAGQSKCLEDARYHLKYLSEAIGAAEPALFEDYVGWARTMLSSRKIPVEDFAFNLEGMRGVLAERLPAGMELPTLEYVESGIRMLAKPDGDYTFLDAGQPLAELANQYLSALLRYERQAALDLIQSAVENKVSIRDLYLLVFERCQYEIGRLWQCNLVSIAQEHYCTAATQLIMSQLYPYIFRGDRASKGTIVAACVSGELHEIGARMICDLLEMEGWNTIYLGANVPASGIVGVLRENGSNILLISASMTFHIRAVREVVAAVRSARPQTSILVGGYAFKVAPNLWRDVGADHYARDASQAIAVVNGLNVNFGSAGE